MVYYLEYKESLLLMNYLNRKEHLYKQVKKTVIECEIPLVNMFYESKGNLRAEIFP